ncbi:hypothetical protein QUF90_21815 [Desulfococcaceae bacterium HSG9]|nr:hypothetical protein [Desulfococcaceae bacterium HSG9]
MKKIIVLLFLSSFLVACGGGSDSGDGGGSGEINTDTPSLAEISGVWDFTRPTSVGDDDVFYMVFRTNGSYIEYDYLGDAFNNGTPCYRRELGSITDLGNGDFEVIDGQGNRLVLHFTRSGSLLTYSDGTTTQTASATPLQESDFLPECAI